MESWMPFFVGVTAVAIVLQAIILIALFRSNPTHGCPR